MLSKMSLNLVNKLEELHHNFAYPKKYRILSLTMVEYKDANELVVLHLLTVDRKVLCMAQRNKTPSKAVAL